MAHDEKDKILHLRNEISLCLDDLAAQVVNSSLASNIRRFSTEIMELEPGFTFGLSQARSLMDETRKTEKQYRAKAIDDTALMDYLNEAQSILKGETIPPDRRVNFMGILNRVIHKEAYKENELKKKIKELESECAKIDGMAENLRKEMKRCVDSSKNRAPDSPEYRTNERKYNAAKNELALVSIQSKNLNKMLEEAERELQLIRHGNAMKHQKEVADQVLVDPNKLEKKVGEAEITDRKIKDRLEESGSIGSSLFEMSEPEVRLDSPFAAEVAASERRDAMMEMAGVDVPKEADAEHQSEFDRLVNDDNTEE